MTTKLIDAKLIAKLFGEELDNLSDDLEAYEISLKYKKSRYAELSDGKKSKGEIITQMIIEDCNNVRFVCYGEAYPITLKSLKDNFENLTDESKSNLLDEDFINDEFGSLDVLQMLVFGEIMVG